MMCKGGIHKCHIELFNLNDFNSMANATSEKIRSVSHIIILLYFVIYINIKRTFWVASEFEKMFSKCVVENSKIRSIGMYMRPMTKRKESYSKVSRVTILKEKIRKPLWLSIFWLAVKNASEKLKKLFLDACPKAGFVTRKKIAIFKVNK